jgi:SAM-dependent methyltransferase
MEIKKDGYGQTTGAIEYWMNHRSKVSDLYDSEQHFFVAAAKEAHSILDIGCAAGGSALFARELNPKSTYIGLDISAEMVKSASERLKDLPQTQFVHFDGQNIPLKNNQVEFSFSFGVFHHLNHWKEMVHEVLRVSSKKVLFDIRVWEKETLIDSNVSYQKLALEGHWDNVSIIPYNIISMSDFYQLACELKLQGISTKAYGYHQKPTYLAVTPVKEVLMLSVLLEKSVEKPTIEINIR